MKQMPPQQAVHLDWVFNSEPLPYSFQDMEQRNYEFSEVFFPGEQAEQVTKQLRQSFAEHFRLSPQQLRVLRTDPQVISDDALDDAVKAADEGGIEAILAFLLNYVDNDSEPEPTIAEQRALRVGRRLRLFLPIFSREIAAALELSQNPPATLRATAETSQLFNHIAQILHMCLAAENLVNAPLSDASAVLDVFTLTGKLIIAFSGVVPLATAKMPQSYVLSNARCFAGLRALCVNRQCVLRLLGRSSDFRRVAELKQTRMSPSGKFVQTLPPPRFSGYVNGSCAELRELEDIFAGSGTGANSQAVCDAEIGALGPGVQLQSNFTASLEADFMVFLDQLSERRRALAGQQEYDLLSYEEITQIEALLSTLPPSRPRGSVEGVENIHGAFIAIKMAADCRSSGLIEAQSPNFSAGSIVYNCGEAKAAEPNEATEFLKNRTAFSYTKPFSYCGRPGVEQLVRNELLKAAEINFDGLEASSIDFAKIRANMLAALPLNMPSSIIRQPRYKPAIGGAGEHNITFLMQAVNFPLFLRALARFGLCGTPGNAETILMQHLMPEISAHPSNNSLACIKHVREVVLKQVCHILHMLIYKAAQVSPALRFYVSRLFSKTTALQEFLICVISEPLGIYTGTADQRLREYGLCLFAPEDSSDLPSDQLSTVTDLLHGRASECREAPFAAYSSTRRLMIVNCALRAIYGIVAHSRHRQVQFSQLYNRVSANYVSALLESAHGEIVEDAEGAEGASSGSQNQRRAANVIGSLSSLGINTKQESAQLDPLNINSFYEFIVGQNASNNPTRQNMACTISCTFPCFQALRVDNMSVLVAFLKVAAHLMPASSAGDAADIGSIFEVPGLSEARNQITKLIYLTAVSAKKVDTFRFNREIVCAGEDERDWEEARELLKAFSGQLSIDWLESDIKNGIKQFGDSMVDAELGYCGKY